MSPSDSGTSSTTRCAETLALKRVTGGRRTFDFIAATEGTPASCSICVSWPM